MHSETTLKFAQISVLTTNSNFEALSRVFGVNF